MTHNTSSAYDLAMFEAAPSQKQAKPELQVVKRRRSAKQTLSVAFTPRVLGAFAIVVTLLSLIVYNQVCLNEITSDINSIQEDLTILESEYTKMASELEAMVSLQSVAEQAREELGMNRLDKYQTRYVNLYGEDQIILAEGSRDSASTQETALAARSFLEGLKEYIAGE